MENDVAGVVAPILGGLFFGSVVIGMAGWVCFGVSNKIPTTTKVEQGYVIPSKLEIEIDDMDRNGEDEVILKYDGQPYLFKLDENGKPVVLPYEIKPTDKYPDFEVKPLKEE